MHLYHGTSQSNLARTSGLWFRFTTAKWKSETFYYYYKDADGDYVRDSRTIYTIDQPAKVEWASTYERLTQAEANGTVYKFPSSASSQTSARAYLVNMKE